MDLDQLAQALVAVGCPPERSPFMAAQLDKRARQLAAQKERTYEDAMAHLLQLMKQGWAAQGSAPGQIDRERQTDGQSSKP